MGAYETVDPDNFNDSGASDWYCRLECTVQALQARDGCLYYFILFLYFIIYYIFIYLLVGQIFFFHCVIFFIQQYVLYIIILLKNRILPNDARTYLRVHEHVRTRLQHRCRVPTFERATVNGLARTWFVQTAGR